MIDPSFQFALSFYAQIYIQLNNYDRAIEIVQKIRAYHPESPEPYLTLGVLYEKLNRNDEAIAEFEKLLEKYPDNSNGMLRLVGQYNKKRDFEKADKQLEEYKKYNKDDSFLMMDYYYEKSNIAMWKGQFRKALDYRHNAYREALKTKDSAQIFTSLSSLSGYYNNLGYTDSALYYLGKSLEYSTGLSKINYPLDFVAYAPERVEEVKGMFEEAAKEFRSRIPSDMWSLVDNVEDLFEAFAKYDTSTMIQAYLDMKKTQSQESNNRTLGRLYTLTGKYEEGKKYLVTFVEGKNETTQAYTFICSHYYLGIAEEGLDNKQSAIEHYNEVLKYWGNADRQIKEIKDTKSRLAKLTS